MPQSSPRLQETAEGWSGPAGALRPPENSPRKSKNTHLFKQMNRRQAICGLASVPVLGATARVLAALPSSKESQGPTRPPEWWDCPVSRVANHPSNFDQAANRLLDELSDRGVHYFADQADPHTGLIFDRAPGEASASRPQSTVASIAATGFGLSALCVAADHKYLSPSACEQRILATLRFLNTGIRQEHGFFPHFVDARTGAPASGSEFSSMDTALLLAGMLHARRFLNTGACDQLASAILSRVDWQWMLNPEGLERGETSTLSMGWHPARGFLAQRWDSYSECLLMYLLAIGSPDHPIPASTWDSIARNTYDYGGIRFVDSYGALFIHQYLHVWTDLRGLRDRHTNYFENSILAVRAHKTWCMLQHGRFPWIDERMWGFSACDTERGSYRAWAAPPAVGGWDGTIAPHAAGGSLTLLPEESIVVLKAIRQHDARAFGRYGFVDAFNPGAHHGQGWYDRDAIAIDLALTLLMAENQRTGSVLRTTMENPEIRSAMRAVGFEREAA